MSNVVSYEVHVYIWTNFSTSKVKRKCIKLSFICRQCLYDKEMAAIIQKGKIKQEILTVAKCIFLSANYIDIFFVIIYFLLEHEPVIYKIFISIVLYHHGGSRLLYKYFPILLLYQGNNKRSASLHSQFTV